MAIKIFAMHSKLFPNWEFWFENIPSGNPGQVSKLHFRNHKLGSFKDNKNIFVT
jgi:hypothetical protein